MKNLLIYIIAFLTLASVSLNAQSRDERMKRFEGMMKPGEKIDRQQVMERFKKRSSGMSMEEALKQAETLKTLL